MLLESLFTMAVVLAVAGAFFVSAAAGLGGSLILVPTLALALGTKEGVALAALLLAANNVVKVMAYRSVLPVRASLNLAVLTIVGSFAGAQLLLALPADVVAAAVIASFALALLAERRQSPARPKVLAPGFALLSGGTSGFSGSSGPLKGIAVRSLGLDRLHTVGAAAILSLSGDLTKAAVFTGGGVLDAGSFRLAVIAAPVMLVATYLGRRFTYSIGEDGYQRLFWVVIGGYTARTVVVAF